jgi:hypothetical protein
MGDMRQCSARNATSRHPVPAEDAALLRDLHAAARSQRGDVAARDALDLACASLVKRGHTLDAVGRVLGLTREAVRLRCRRVPAALLAGIERDSAAGRG